MEHIFLKRKGGIYYRHPEGTLCVYQREGVKYYAEWGRCDQILLYGLDDGTFTSFRLIPSHMKYVYSVKFKSYRADKKGTVKIIGHYPFFVAVENKIKKYGTMQKGPSQLIYTPVWLDIDGKFYRQPVLDLKEKLRNRKAIPKPKRNGTPIIQGKFNCLQCRQPLENVRRAGRLFCSQKCSKIHLYVRSKETDYMIPDFRTNRDLEEEGLAPAANYYVCVHKVSAGGQVRVDWIGGPYDSESAAMDASGAFYVRYQKDHGWSNGYNGIIKRLIAEKPTMYGFKP